MQKSYDSKLMLIIVYIYLFQFQFYWKIVSHIRKAIIQLKIRKVMI